MIEIYPSTKYAVGDTVTTEFSKSYNKKGTIIDINPESSYPYVIDWGETVGACAEDKVILIESIGEPVINWLGARLICRNSK